MPARRPHVELPGLPWCACTMRPRPSRTLPPARGAAVPVRSVRAERRCLDAAGSAQPDGSVTLLRRSTSRSERVASQARPGSVPALSAPEARSGTQRPRWSLLAVRHVPPGAPPYASPSSFYRPPGGNANDDCEPPPNPLPPGTSWVTSPPTLRRSLLARPRRCRSDRWW
jgi:hypothetical protein